MRELLVAAINDSDVEQLQELLAIITDIEKANAVIYSTYLGNIELLKLLIEAEAVLDRPDADGHTALYWAKEHGHQAMVHLLHQHGAREEQISVTTMALLKTVGLKQADLTALGIRLEDVERSANPSFLGQWLHFLVSVSLIKTFMLWPFLRRGSIKLNREDETEVHFTRPGKYKDERLSISESEDARLLSTHELIDTEEESEGDEIVIKDEVDTHETLDQAVFLEKEIESYLGEERKHKRKMCSSPIFTSSALLFESENILKVIAAINAFHETAEKFIDSIWSGFLTSLLIHAIYNFYQYPEERDGNTLVNVLGFGSIANMFCIRSIDFFQNYLCFGEAKKGYEEVLAASLDSPYIWPFVAGIPILFGLINGIRAGLDTKTLTTTDVQNLIQKLKQYKPGFWADNVGWIFSAAIPDLFPPAAVFFALPQPDIKRALEKITFSIIWDGQLPYKNRLALFYNLSKFAEQRSQLTQMKALSMLADIVQGIDNNNLALLQSEGVDAETLKTLLMIKVQAFQQLHFLANHYNLPTAPRHYLRPLPRYIYANYLLWNLGHPQQWFLHPLFFTQKAIKLYFSLMFYKAILDGVVNIINRYVDEKKCRAEGKTWNWIEVWQNYSCTYCGDFPIYVYNFSSPGDCLRTYLEFTRTLDEVLKIINRFNTSKPFFLDDLDLSMQTDLIKAGNLTKLLDSLLASFKPRSGFYLMNNNLDADDVASIMNFISNGSVSPLNFENTTLTYGGIKVLSAALKNMTALNTLALSHLLPMDAIVLSQGLNGSMIYLLGLFNSNIGVDGIKAIGKNLYQNGSTSGFPNGLTLQNCSMTSEGCIALAQELYRFSAFPLDLSLENNPINSSCAKALAQTLPNILNLTLGSSGFIGNEGVKALANALQQNSLSSSLDRLSLTGYNVSDEAIVQLIDALPHTKLSAFHFTDNRLGAQSNYTALVLRLIYALNDTKIVSLGWSGSHDYSWRDEETILFARAIEEGLIKVNELNLNNNQIGSAGMQALARALPKTHIETLRLRNNSIGEGIRSLSGYLNHSIGYNFDFANNNITTEDVKIFTESMLTIKPFIWKLDFSENSIGNEGAIRIITAFGGKLRFLYLNNTNITAEGAVIISQLLVKTNHGLWINGLASNKKAAILQPATRIDTLHLAGNLLEDEGVRALCGVLPYAGIMRRDFIFDVEGIDPRIVQSCGAATPVDISSNANSLNYESLYPYILLCRFYRAIWKTFADTLSIYFNKLSTAQITTEKNIQHNSLTEYLVETYPTFSFSWPLFNNIDVSQYQDHETVVINLNAKWPLQSTLKIPTNVNAVIGNAKNNHLIVCNEQTLIDVSQNKGKNLLIAGKNNTFMLGEYSYNHIVIEANQGLINIFGFNHRDILHVFDKQRIYLNHQGICSEINSSAILQLRGTKVQLARTRCENITQQILFNNQTALEEAHAEVMMSSEQAHSTFYASLLSTCETFLNSASKSALLTAVPAFASEVLYRSGGYTRGESENFGQEIQKLLVLSFADSPHVMAASFLASWLAAKLTHSSHVISTISIGASMAASVVSTIFSANVSLSWMALQTGVALMGSVVGSYSVRCGLDKASEAKAYLHNKLNFWSNQPERDSRQAHHYDTNSTIAYR